MGKVLLQFETRITCDLLHKVNYRNVLKGTLVTTVIWGQLHLTRGNVVTGILHELLPLVNRVEVLVE
jgi:hypothetical protein